MTFDTIARRLTAATMKTLGNDVEVGIAAGKGILSAPTERIIDGMVVTIGWELEYSIDDFPVVLRGDLVVVDSVNYVAREDGMIKGDLSTGVVPLELEADQAEVEYIIDGNG